MEINEIRHHTVLDAIDQVAERAGQNERKRRTLAPVPRRKAPHRHADGDERSHADQHEHSPCLVSRQETKANASVETEPKVGERQHFVKLPRHQE